MSYNFIVVLTVYKRNHLENQLKSVYSQTITPKYVIVFQNENHINIDSLKKTYDFLHVKNDYNTNLIYSFIIYLIVSIFQIIFFYNMIKKCNALLGGLLVIITSIILYKIMYKYITKLYILFVLN